MLCFLGITLASLICGIVYRVNNDKRSSDVSHIRVPLFFDADGEISAGLRSGFLSVFRRCQAGQSLKLLHEIAVGRISAQNRDFSEGKCCFREQAFRLIYAEFNQILE